ncbi:Crp/Fnr family transcriptional regulator [Halobacteriovorax sp. HLS]|uniref:Crp/Fnr family transcriptional regulator n=1 Tax=Halobacteriovorax sp. HLS TaxID=2234000 RepID=UPI000FD7C675|nr:cyclic nucleotide-binding domain-containing protein [Halobacteriovorax sp. HLS]
MNQLSGPLTLNLKRGDIICAEGENEYDLFIVHSGKILIFVTSGTKVTPLAHIEAGEYLGELSFFDKKSRSASAVCLEDTTVIKVPVEEVSNQFPDWLETLATSITARLRVADELLAKKGIRKKNVKTMPSLSIEEQREYYSYLQAYKSENGLIDKEE